MSEEQREIVAQIKDKGFASKHAVTRELTDPIELRRLMASQRTGQGSRTASFGAAGVMDFGVHSSGLPSVLAANSPISTFFYTLSRSDRINLYRYFGRHDPFVTRAIELHAELPLSRMSIGPPKGPNHRQNREINRIYEHMVERLDLFQLLLEIGRELPLVGDVYLWHEWDEQTLEWKDIYVLPAEFCHSVAHPFNRRKELIFFARPLVDTTAIRRMTDRDLYLVAEHDIERLYQTIGADMPDELKQALQYGEAVNMNTDWRKGSYVVHLARNKPPNEEYGQSMVERCLETLIRLENLKNAQIQISGRNMQPKHLVWAEGIGEGQLKDLRAQVDLSLLENADFPIVTNFQVNWQTIGASDRLLQLEGEYATLLEALSVGMGTTRDLLTGQATYGGQRITVELMNTQYLSFRETIKTYVHECIFRPVAEAKGHYYREEIDTWVKVESDDIEVGDDIIQEQDGTLRRKMIQVNKVYNHSSLRFNRLSIRDNTEVYDQLFQLYQKGSLAVRYLLDLHNIDPEENSVALLEDLGTVKDSSFNDLVRGMYTELSPMVVQNTNILERIIDALNLDVRKVPLPATGMLPGAGGMGLGGGLGGAMPPDMGMGGLGGGMGMNELGGPETLGPGGGIGGQGLETTPNSMLESGNAQPTAATFGVDEGDSTQEFVIASTKDLPPVLPGRQLHAHTIEAIVKAGRNARLTPTRVKKIIDRYEED